MRYYIHVDNAQLKKSVFFNVSLNSVSKSVDSSEYCGYMNWSLLFNKIYGFYSNEKSNVFI